MAQRDLLVIDAGALFATTWTWTEHDTDPVATPGWSARATFGRWPGRPAELTLEGVQPEGSCTLDTGGRVVLTVEGAASLAATWRWALFAVNVVPPAPDTRQIRLVEGLALIRRGVTA